MTIAKHINFFFFLFFFFNSVSPHGFLENTFLLDKSGNHWQMGNIFQAMENGTKLSVLSYDLVNHTWRYKKVKTAGFTEANCYCSVVCNDDKAHPLCCSPLQLFYRVQDDRWIQAYKLSVGDSLLCAHDQQVTVSAISLVHETINLYTLEVKNTHTFVVSRLLNIVYHLMYHKLQDL